jgi:thiol-disulfide isomerase/thioredoxin
MSGNGRRTEARPSARRKRTALMLGGVVAAAIVGIAVFSGGQRGGTSVQGTAALEEPAPEVTLTDFDGESFSLQSYEGRPVVMNFWASWCPFCVAEMPGFEKVHRAVSEEVVFLGIDQCESCQGGSRKAAERLARETGVTYRLAEDPNGSVFVAFGGSSMPTTIFIDADGRVVEHVGGMMSEEQLRDYIARLFGVGDA